MRRVGVLFFAFVFLFCMSAVPVRAVDSKEIEELKGEIQKLMKRLENLEKQQKETSTKAAEADKIVAEVQKKTEKIEKKALKDRIEFSGESRFRIMSEKATTDRGFYGAGKPVEDAEYKDKTSFPLRVRLNAHVEAVPDWVDFYARLTMNKRWGAFDDTAADPFNKRNSYEASIGKDINARFEQAYITLKIPPVNGTWYVGRLPGLDGAPSRQAGSLFPRPFIDSEIDGTLVKLDAPETFLDKIQLPWTGGRLWGTSQENVPTRKTYESKVKEKTGVIFGYLKYDERKTLKKADLDLKADSDAYLAQARVKLGKDTEVILDGLYMDDWHMPNKDTSYVPDLKTDYYLAGTYVDTQLLGFQIYGAYYYSHFKVADHTFSPGGTGDPVTVDDKGYPGHLWFAGFNTGDLIHPKHQLTVEFADGSDAWINPFNYRGYRRKGTVLQPQGNFFYDPAGSKVVGFYPFNAQVWDIYYDYYFRSNVRFRLGYMDFMYTKHDKDSGEDFSVLGSSKFQHDYWPYFEINVSF